MKKACFFFVVLTLVLLCGCAGNSKEAERPTHVLKTQRFVPELVLSGDVEERITLNILENCVPIEEGGRTYSLLEVMSHASPLGEIENVMIFANSRRGVGINLESADKYYLTVNNNGIIYLNSDIDVHNKVASFPLASVGEIMFCASAPTEAGVLRMTDDMETRLGFEWLVVSYELYSRVKNAIYEGEESPLVLTLYSKNAPSASVLTNGNSDCVAVLENGTEVLITENSRYTVHWANGGLYLKEFVSPIKILDFRTESHKNESVADSGGELRR